MSNRNRIRECVSLSSLKTILAKMDCLQFSSIGTDPCSQNKGSISFQFSIKITITITFCSILFFFQMQMNPGSEIKRLRQHQFSISPSFGARYQCKHFGSSSFQTRVISTLVSFFTLSDLPFLMLHILKRNSFKKKNFLEVHQTLKILCVAISSYIISFQFFSISRYCRTSLENQNWSIQSRKISSNWGNK